MFWPGQWGQNHRIPGIPKAVGFGLVPAGLAGSTSFSKWCGVPKQHGPPGDLSHLPSCPRHPHQGRLRVPQPPPCLGPWIFHPSFARYTNSPPGCMTAEILGREVHFQGRPPFSGRHRVSRDIGWATSIHPCENMFFFCSLFR